MIYNLKDQLAKHECSVARFARMYPKNVVPLDRQLQPFNAVIITYNGDKIIKQQNAVIKANQYMADEMIPRRQGDATPNFFFEEIGNHNRNDVGGPWLALKDEADVYIELFLNRWYYCLNLRGLVARLNEMIKMGHATRLSILNAGHITYGYPVDRKLFADLFTRVENGSLCGLFNSLQHVLRKS